MICGEDNSQAAADIIAEDFHASHAQEGLRALVTVQGISQRLPHQLVELAVEVFRRAAFIADSAGQVGALKLKETSEYFHQVWFLT